MIKTKYLHSRDNAFSSCLHSNPLFHIYSFKLHLIMYMYIPNKMGIKARSQSVTSSQKFLTVYCSIYCHKFLMLSNQIMCNLILTSALELPVNGRARK